MSLSNLKGDINLLAYLFKVLKSVHPTNSIRSSALSQTNAMINIIGRVVASKATELLASTGRKTCGAKEIQNAVRLIFPDGLAKHATSEGAKALTYYNNAVEQRKEKPKEDRPPKIRSEILAKLVFPPARVGKFISAERVRMEAKVYLAGVLEYLSAEIFELSGNYARDHKRVRIDLRAISTIIEQDEELCVLMKKLQIKFAAAGVIRPTETTSEKPKKKKFKIDKVTNKRHYLPGGKAEKDIKEQQDLFGCVIFSKSRFGALVKFCLASATDHGNKKWRVELDAKMALQMAVESKMVEFLMKVYEVVKNGKRKKMTDQDIAVMMKILDLNYERLSYNEEQSKIWGIKTPQIRRLSQKAGVEMISSKAIVALKSIIYNFVFEVIRCARIVALQHKRVTLALSDIIFALNNSGIRFAYSKSQKKSSKC